MHTKDKLAAALFEAGLDDMAAKAATGWYDDYLSPLAAPIVQLVTDLKAFNTPESHALAKRAIDGEFDGTKEEGDAWADSAKGRETLAKLLKPGQKFRP